MCEMLIRVVDKVNDDPYLDAKCTKRGDVITVQPDGWGWSRAELRNPDWRIIKIPGVTVIEAESFLGAEMDADPANPSQVLQRRAFRLDVDALPDSSGQVGDASRRNPLHRVNIDYDDLMALKISKPPLVDPNVFD